jgi:hypothetical protein
MSSVAAQPLAVLRRAAALLASSLEFEQTLRNVIALCLPALGDFGFFDVVTDDGDVRRTNLAHEDPEIDALLAQTRWQRQTRTDDLNLCALSTGAAARHPEIDEVWLARVATGPEHLAVMRRLGFRSMI